MPQHYAAMGVGIAGTGHMGMEELVSRLRDLGYYDGPAEVEPWPRTLLALRRFQHLQGLPVTGYPDTATARALREAYCY